MSRERLLTVAVVIMVCAAVLSSSMAIRQYLASPAAEPISTEPYFVEDWERFASPGSRLGPADATVVIVEFSDFQCRFCKQHAETLDRLREKYPNELAIIFRHFPVAHTHPHAYEAAHAAECAGDQHRFDEYRRVLYQNQQEIGSIAWLEFAREAGVADTAAFQRCMSADRHAQRIEQDLTAGRELGIPATPTSLVNGWKVLGALDEARLDTLIAQALARR